MTVAEFIEKYSPKFKATQVDARPDGLSLTWVGSRHYLCSFTTTRGQFTTFFSQGKEIKVGPILADVLDCLKSDAGLGDMTYREACNEFGVEMDYRTWLACRETRDNIIDTFGRNGFADLLSLDCD